MTLVDVQPLDLDALDAARGDGFALEHSEAYAPVLHLLLETKAAALPRIIHTGFLDAELGEPYRLLRDQWNRYDSFWHSNAWNQVHSQLESNLEKWRVAKLAHTYLTKQRENGRMGPGNEEMKTHLQRLEEIRAVKRRGGFSQLQEWGLDSELSELVSREHWFTNQDFEKFTTRILEPGEVESAAASVIRHSYQVVDEWISSEGRQHLKASVEDEYYAARPWLTEEDRAITEKRRIAVLLENINPPSRTVISGNTSASTGDYLVPSPEMQVHDIRSLDGKLLPDQSSFTISSGSLLWGQIIGLYTTMSNPNFTQNANHMPPPLEGGTILQHRHSYRSAARNGRWKVRAFYERERREPAYGALVADPDAPERQTGWIVYHEHVDPVNTLDREIAYINRYDWSHHSRSSLDPEFQE
ncbi:hypothetical protein OQA88_5290 [Cercophora sp. LCS_1]